MQRVHPVIHILPLLAFLLTSGCAILNRDNTPTFNYVEKNIWTDHCKKHPAALPLVLPLGLGAVATDAAIVHPLSVIDDSARSTKDEIWDDWDLEWDKEYVTECVKLPWRVAGTPTFFSLQFLGRSIFDIDSEASKVRQREDRKLLLDELTTCMDLLEKGNAAEALKRLEEMNKSHTSREWSDSMLQSAMILVAAHRTGQYDRFQSTMAPQLNWVSVESASEVKPDSNDLRQRELCRKAQVMYRQALDQMEAAAEPGTRLKAFVQEIKGMNDESKRKGILRMLKDPNPILRYRAVQELYKWSELFKESLPELEGPAQAESDPLLRDLLSQYVRKVKNNESITWLE